MTDKQLINKFISHPPYLGGCEEMRTMRRKALGLAEFINEHCPEGEEKSAAITHIQIGMMLACNLIAQLQDES